MKHDQLPRFMREYRGLSATRKVLFFAAVREINRVFANRGASALPRWPAKLRVKDVEGHPGVWEVTWAWPDGRATFEYFDAGGEVGIRWRRIGGHEIFGEP